jgi:hypothetical protein
MAKFVDWSQDKDVQGIMERFLERFPGMFEGFDPSRIGFLMTAKKKSREPIRLHCVGYPFDVFCSSKVYIVEVFKGMWSKMDAKKRNLAVFRAMCAIPDGGFDEQSRHYAKKLQPEIRMFMKEYAACGGVPNWMENPAAVDPMERTSEEIAEDVPAVEAIPEEPEAKGAKKVTRVPITKDAIEG